MSRVAGGRRFAGARTPLASRAGPGSLLTAPPGSLLASHRWPRCANGVFLTVFQAHPQRTDKLAAPTRTMSTTAPKTTPAPASFETALAELETIVATMESGQLPLAESLAAYKRGAELLQYCQTALKDAQQQVQILERGVLKSFEPDVAQAPGSDEVNEP